MEPPPDYKDIVIQAKSIPSAPSYVSVFQQTAPRSNSLFDVLEGKETQEAEKKQQTTNDEDKIAKISYFTSSHDFRSPRECSIRSITNQDVRPSDEIHNNEKVSSPKQKFTKLNKNSHNLEGQKAFVNRVAVHNYPERFPNEEDECSTAFGKTVSRTPSQAVSIPEKAFVETPYQFHSETVLNHAQLGRYFYKLPSQHEERSVAIDKEEKELQPETRIVTVEPLSTANTVDNVKVQNEFPGLNVSPYGPNYTDREKRRKESYVFDEKRDSGVHAESERIHEKRTYCFVNMCFCASCRCALCSTSCTCTWLHCLPCLSYTTLCCPFWVVCLFCSFFNPCWKEILHVTSSFLKHLASNCKSEPGNNCSFTCLADDAEETLWDVRNWGCGFEEAEEL